MKNILLSLIFLTFALSGLKAQSFAFYDHDNNLIDNGSVFEVIEAPGSGVAELLFTINIQNTSANELNVMCKKNYISVLDDTYNMFCWGMCYGPNVMISDTLTMASGETTANDYFSGHYYHNDNQGTTTIQYVFYDAENPSDSAYVNVNYVLGYTGLGSDFDNEISALYPNPVENTGYIDYNLNFNDNARIVINNLTGAKVKEITLNNNQGTASVDVTDLFSGVYFYTVITDGKAINTGKLIVK